MTLDEKYKPESIFNKMRTQKIISFMAQRLFENDTTRITLRDIIDANKKFFKKSDKISSQRLRNWVNSPAIREEIHLTLRNKLMDIEALDRIVDWTEGISEDIKELKEVIEKAKNESKSVQDWEKVGKIISQKAQTTMDSIKTITELLNIGKQEKITGYEKVDLTEIEKNADNQTITKTKSVKRELV